MSIRSARQEQGKPPVPEVRRRRLSHLLGALAALGAAITPWQDSGRSRKPETRPELSLTDDITEQVGGMDRRATEDLSRVAQYLQTAAREHLDKLTEGDQPSSFDAVMEETGTGAYTELMTGLRDLLEDDATLRQRLDHMLTAASIHATAQDIEHIIERMQQITFTADYNRQAINNTDKIPSTLISHPELGELARITRGSQQPFGESITVQFFGSRVAASEAGQGGDYPFHGSIGPGYGTVIGGEYGQVGETERDILESLLYEFLPEQ